MDFIRQFFFLRTIYHRQTFTHIVMIYGLIALVGSSFTLGLMSSGNAEATVYYNAIFIAYGYFLARTLLRSLIVERRLGDSRPAIAPKSHELTNASINFELNNIDAVREIATYDDGRLYDVVFNFYQKTKHGEYLAKEVYYTVFETSLQRQLPHLMFDSTSAKHKQFKYLYVASQKISIQGGFDDYFDTYTPETYHIDSLSFITPEVMQTLITAKDYDIEIIGNKLLLYAPLVSLRQAGVMADLGASIVKEINDNIDHYRDNRLKGVARTTNVTPFGRALLMSSRRYVITASLAGVALVTYIISAFSAHAFEFEFFALLVFFFAANTYKAIALQRKNDKIRAEYYYLYQTDRGRPLGSLPPGRR